MTFIPYVIYGLAHPKTHIVRYVGKSKNVKIRIRMGYRRHSKIGIWLSDLNKQKLQPILVVLESNEKDCWKSRERYWIQKLRKSGLRLLNVSPGGNGSHRYNSLPLTCYRMLGKIPDTQIAKIAGLTRKAIAYHRNLSGIPMAPMSTRLRSSTTFQKGLWPFGKIDISPKIIAKLGLISDAEIADLVGLCRSSIARRRRALGIQSCRGVRHRGDRNAKLSIVQVLQIRTEFPNTAMRVLARRYKVCVSTIHRIILRKTWSHV